VVICRAAGSPNSNEEREENMHRKGFVALLLFMLVVLPVAASAQEEMKFSNVEVALWPEYDRPAVLVIYHISLPSQMTLPAEISLRIPAAAGSPNAVAASGPDGSLINIPYTSEKEGDWLRLNFQATSPELQLEYYDPTLVKDGASRHFEYTWPGDYAAQAFSVEVQQPLTASQMRIEPGMVSSQQAADGFTYYRTDIGEIPDGKTVAIEVDYEKDNDELSAANAPVEPTGPLDDTTKGRSSMMSALPWVLGLIGVLLIVGGGAWYWFSGRQKPPTEKSKRRSRRKTSPQGVSGGVESGQVYCHQCGKRAGEGDRFCRTCGAALRTG
jgi:hypothetical protein